MPKWKRFSHPKPNVTGAGKLVCSYCGHLHIRMTNGPSWDVAASKRRRYQCMNHTCRRGWFTREEFETNDQASLATPAEPPTYEVTPCQGAPVCMPPSMVLFISGDEFPDTKLRAKLGIGHVAGANVQYTDQGPSGGPGWYFVRDSYRPGDAEWLQIGELWVGVQRNVEQTPATVKVPLKKSKPKSSRLYRAFCRQMKREFIEEIADSLRQQGA